LRESIQRHRRLVWLLAGSHRVDELTHAPWPSYLVSVRTIEIPPFTLAETRLLLTQPLAHSGLFRDKETERPRFAPDFWGEGGIERIHALAGGWPHLVQLLAEAAVDLVNEREAGGLDAAMLDAAVAQAVVAGDTVLRQLVKGECESEAEWAWLQGFAAREAQPPPADPAVRRSLLRREIVHEAEDGWRLRAPLMALWLPRA
jgi:hypothetical protein